MKDIFKGFGIGTGMLISYMVYLYVAKKIKEREAVAEDIADSVTEKKKKKK